MSSSRIGSGDHLISIAAGNVGLVIEDDELRDEESLVDEISDVA